MASQIIYFTSTGSQNNKTATYSDASATYYITNYNNLPYLWLGPGSTSNSTTSSYKIRFSFQINDLRNLVYDSNGNQINQITSLKLSLVAAVDAGNMQNKTFTAAFAVSNTGRYSRLWSEIKNHAIASTSGILSQKTGDNTYDVDITQLADALINNVAAGKEIYIHMANTVTNENNSSKPFAFYHLDDNSRYPCLLVEYEPAKKPITGITLTPNSKTLIVNNTEGLNKFLPTVNLTPSDATGGYYWSTNDPSVVSLPTSSDLNFTALKNGSTWIFARSLDSSDVWGGCEVTVKTDIEGMRLSTGAVNLKVGETYSITGTVLPEGTVYDSKVREWLTDNSSIATVTKTGDNTATITAVAPGTAKISANSPFMLKNGSLYFYAQCTVNVTEAVKEVTDVTLNKTQSSLPMGRSETLSVTVSPSDATDKTITWSTSNSSIATVSNGTVTAVKPGTCTITATANNGVSASCEIKVLQVVYYKTNGSFSPYLFYYKQNGEFKNYQVKLM